MRQLQSSESPSGLLDRRLVFSLGTLAPLRDLYVRNAFGSLACILLYPCVTQETLHWVIWLFLATSCYVLFFSQKDFLYQKDPQIETLTLKGGRLFIPTRRLKKNMSNDLSTRPTALEEVSLSYMVNQRHRGAEDKLILLRPYRCHYQT